MSLRISGDHSRFKDIIRGRIKKHLKDYIKNGEFISKQGDDKITVPLPQIDLPKFKYGSAGSGGVAQGKGEVGDPVSKKQEDGEGGQGKAGADGGEHILEMEVSLNELADMLGEELELPRIEPKGRRRLTTKKQRYSGVHLTGPQSLRHFKHSFKNALKRQISTGTYNAANPIVVPMKEDMRYRSFKPIVRPESNAVIIYMMDVSGSMGEEQKEIVRIEAFWIDTWLRRHYDGIESRYIIHDAIAKEVDRETFFHTRESGGTMISSAYKLGADIIEKDYPSDDWNIYLFHFSDGDNWSVDDTRLCVGILKNRILNSVNQFSYGQVESPYGSGQFIKDLKEHLQAHEKVALSEIKDKDGIYGSIKDFLSQGR
ncbi:MAG: DUF444 family protein [Myxococcota bacterium]